MENTTVGELLHWSYANLAMAHSAISAISAKAETYSRTQFMIRARLYAGLNKQTMNIGPLAAAAAYPDSTDAAGGRLAGAEGCAARPIRQTMNGRAWGQSSFQPEASRPRNSSPIAVDLSSA